jgi:hypothetical protein
MAMHMKGTGRLTRRRVEVHVPMQMEMYMKETGRMTRRGVEVHIPMQIEMYMYEISPLSSLSPGKGISKLVGHSALVILFAIIIFPHICALLFYH